MRVIKMPEPLRQGERAKQLNTKLLNRPLHITTIPKVSKQKLHWSRRPEQRRKDEKILALFGLAFRKVPGTTCHRLGRREQE